MNLFLDKLPELDNDFRKEAGFASRLSENVENWPQELTSELYKQLPFLSDYEVSVNLDKAEPQRGYAFGYADIANKTERPEIEHTDAGLPHIRIPLVVQERAVKPFSVFLDGEKVLPLSEERVREVLFNPGTFDLSTKQPQDPSLVEQLQPPTRSGMGMGGEYKQASADLDKEAGIKDRAAKHLGDVVGDAVGQVGKRYAPHVAGGVAGTTGLVGGAAYVGGKKGGKAGVRAEIEKARVAAGLSKTAAAQQIQKYTGTSGLGDIVAEWMKDVGTLKNLDLDEEYQLREKVAFNHMSKPQWDAIYKSDNVQKLVAKNGTMAHPEVINKVYEMASKVFGFHPKVYSKPPGMQAAAGGAKAAGGAAKPAAAAAKPATPKPAAAGGAPAKPVKTPALPPKTKGASARPSLLMAIASTIREKDREAFIDKVAADPTLVAGFSRSGISKVLVEAFDNTKYASTADVMQTLADRIDPTCVTIQRLPGGDFLFKSAANTAFNPQSAQGQVVPGPEAADAIGAGSAQAMQPGQTATAVADPVEPPNPLAEQEAEAPAMEGNEKVCDEFGEWLVQDAMGNRLLGWVFPMTLAWDGNFTPQPLALFTNGSAYAFQDAIAGELVGKSCTFPVDVPRGDGVFYSVENGRAICTSPLTIGSAAAGPDGQTSFMGQDLMGAPVQVHVAEGIGQPTRVSDTEYALPSTWKFMRLNNQTQLATDPSQMNKMAAIKEMNSGVTLFYNGTYNLEGGCGLSKLAQEFRYDLDPMTAEFMLGVLGVHGTVAKQKVAEARRKGSVKLAGLKSITLLSERYNEATKTASEMIEKLPNLQRDLLKEAASVQDEGTVDSMLALNFINPENMAVFVSYMPELEQSSEKLAEMLLSCYVGMNQLPEGAIERGMKNLEEVISGLKSLQHSEG